MSTIFSIFYFLFSYSFINSNIVVEKSLSLFSEILDFHAMNRPPFSYEIFTQKERDLIYAFGRSSFYRNYSLFESIFQYEVSICFFSKDPRPIPYRSLPPLPTLKDSLKCVEPIPEILRKLIDEKEEEVDEEEEEIEKMEAAGEVEGNQAKGFLTTKINEINKEINEKISLCTRTVINPVNETLSEKERAKKGK